MWRQLQYAIYARFEFRIAKLIVSWLHVFIFRIGSVNSDLESVVWEIFAQNVKRIPLPIIYVLRISFKLCTTLVCIEMGKGNFFHFCFPYFTFFSHCLHKVNDNMNFSWDSKWNFVCVYLWKIFIPRSIQMADFSYSIWRAINLVVIILCLMRKKFFSLGLVS